MIIPAEKYVEIEFADNEHVKVRETPNGEVKIITLSTLPETAPGVTYEEWAEGMP